MAQPDNAFDDVGTGPPVIFLHGFPFSRKMWRAQIEFLSANGHRCIAPDLRGLGENVLARRSDEAVNVSKMDDMARDIVALMDQLQIQSAVICGLSMGCYVAFELIHLFPARVSALVLCGPRAQGPDQAEKKSREAQAQLVLAEGMSVALASIPTMLAVKTVTEKPSVVEEVLQMVLDTPLRGAAAAQRGMAIRRDYFGQLASISVPALIMAGAEDGVRTPEDAEFIHQRIKDSRLEVMADAGHLMNMEQPDRFNKTLIGFLAGLNH